MRTVLLGVLAWLAAAAPAWADGSLARLRALLDEALGTPEATGPHAEPAGEVSIDYSPAGRPIAALAEAGRAEQERNWRRAAELYQRLLDEAPDELCRPAPRLYVPIHVWVEERLARLPPEGLAAYRAHVDVVAGAAFAAAGGDRGRLAEAVRRFLLSSPGGAALDRLATAWLARGEAGRALRAWRRLLALCPDALVPPGQLAAKLAVCFVQLGHADAAREFLSKAAEALGAEATASIAGRTIPLPGPLLANLDSIGNRQSAIADGLRPGPLVWSDALQPSRPAAAVSPFRERLVLELEAPAPEPAVRVLPIVAAGAAIYPGQDGLTARDAATGAPRWVWPWPYQHTLSAWAAAPGTHGWTASADASAAYCAVPFLATGRVGGEPRLGGHLVALELRSGVPRWQRSAAEALPADRAAAGGAFVSAPLPIGERLVVGLRGGAAGDDYYLCGLRARDGALLWRTFIAARPAEPFGRMGRYQTAFEAQPAAGRGLAVACAGGGIAAGVELDTGAIRWLVRYDQNAGRRAGWRWFRPDGWRGAAPLVADGIAWLAPPDSDYLYAIEVETGQVLWRRERGDHRYLAGPPCGGRVWAVGADAACLDARGAVIWQAPLPSPAVGRPALGLRGRGTRDEDDRGLPMSLAVPLAGGILYLDAGTGSELAWASWEAWAAARGPDAPVPMASGDLTLSGGRLLVTTALALHAFGPLERREAIVRQLAADPDDPLAQHALGQESHWWGDAAGAVAALERALELAAARPGALSEALLGDVRRRLAACQSDLSRAHEHQGRLEPALAACEAALRLVPEGPEHHALLLRRAELAGRLGRWAVAAEACHEAIRAAQPGQPEWAAARDRLQAVLLRAGRQPYEPFERQAAELLARGDEASLEAVVRLYPNSLSAPRALEALASAAERSARPGQARLWRIQLVKDYPDAASAPDVAHRLAIGYAAEDAAAMARGVLAWLRRRLPRGEGEAPRGEWAEACRDPAGFLGRHGAAQPPQPPAKLEPPLSARWTVRPSYGAAEVGVSPATSPNGDMFFILAGRSIECRAMDTGALLWSDRPGWIGIRIVDAERRGGGVRIIGTVSDRLDAPAERAGLRGGDVLVRFDGKPLRDAQDLIATCTERRAGEAVALEFLRGDDLIRVTVRLGARPSLADDPQTPPAALIGVVGGLAFVRKASRLEALKLETGEAAWALPLGPSGAAPDEPGAHLAAAAPGIVAIAHAAGRITALDPASGHKLWSQRIEEPTLHNLLLWPHGLAVASSRPATVRALNAFDGTVAFEVADPRAGGAPAVALDASGRLCYAMGGAMGCWDAARGEMAWASRIPNFTARALWAAGPNLVAHGEDDAGVEAIECRQAATGLPAWSLALARGERLLFADAAADAFYLASRQGARTIVRRLAGSTGQVAWAVTLRRGEELVAWADAGPALVLGLSVADAEGTRRAELSAIDRLSGGEVERLMLGVGALAGIRRIGASLCAVLEAEPGAARAPVWFGDDVLAQPPAARIVRITGN